MPKRDDRISLTQRAWNVQIGKGLRNDKKLSS